jgi:hypothetical protein
VKDAAMQNEELRIVLQNLHAADTEDLLDRVTAYRAGMEPDVIGFIEDELEKRGVTTEEIAAQADQYRRECLYHPDGAARMCSLCRRPAVAAGWGWHRMFSAAWRSNPNRVYLPGRLINPIFEMLPLFYPRYFYYCAEHRPEPPPATSSE